MWTGLQMEFDLRTARRTSGPDIERRVKALTA